MSTINDENLLSAEAPGASANNEEVIKVYSEWTMERCEKVRECFIPIVWWGDEMYDAEIEMLKNETPAQKTERVKREAAAEMKSHTGLVNFCVKRKEEKWCKGGEMKFRVPKPCKYASLFEQRICAGPTCGKKVPEGQTKCSCGEILAGCWNHAEKHSCIYVHPDEPQWEAACSGALCFDRQQQVFHLKTEPLAQNRFTQVSRSAKNESQSRPSGKKCRVEKESAW